MEVLKKEGIPVYAGSSEGYFETREIGVLLDYLRILNNKRQDVPLASVLRSIFGHMTDEEPVSYTHLDVYKRQVGVIPLFFGV